MMRIDRFCWHRFLRLVSGSSTPRSRLQDRRWLLFFLAMTLLIAGRWEEHKIEDLFSKRLQAFPNPVAQYELDTPRVDRPVSQAHAKPQPGSMAELSRLRTEGVSAL